MDRDQAAESAAAHFVASAQHKEVSIFPSVLCATSRSDFFLHQALELLADALEKEREDMAEELSKTAEDFARCVRQSEILSEQLEVRNSLS